MYTCAGTPSRSGRPCRADCLCPSAAHPTRARAVAEASPIDRLPSYRHNKRKRDIAAPGCRASAQGRAVRSVGRPSCAPAGEATAPARAAHAAKRRQHAVRLRERRRGGGVGSALVIPASAAASRSVPTVGAAAGSWCGRSTGWW
eukprot:358519-Chlamydomonas_euryale.AAC.7